MPRAVGRRVVTTPSDPPSVQTQLSGIQAPPSAGTALPRCPSAERSSPTPGHQDLCPDGRGGLCSRRRGAPGWPRGWPRRKEPRSLSPPSPRPGAERRALRW